MGGTLVWSGSLGVEQGVRHVVFLGMSSSEQLVETSKIMGGTLGATGTTRASGTVGKVANGALKYVA